MSNPKDLEEEFFQALDEAELAIAKIREKFQGLLEVVFESGRAMEIAEREWEERRGI